MGRTMGWYWQRLRRMSPAEVVWRGRDQARRLSWRRRWVRTGQSWPAPSTTRRTSPPPLPTGAATAVPCDSRRSLLECADRLLDGQTEILGVSRTDMVAPDWFRDPLSGRQAPQGRYCFSIDHHAEEVTGNVKQVWELSRHHHLTTLAAAWYLSGDDRYAEAVAGQLRDWWRQNPFLSGIHWTSGIELGIRLISWVWVRRLLDGWPGVVELFEANDDAALQISWHQQYLAAFPSVGSSANNHVIAEAAGQLAAACAFPWFPASARWRAEAAALLERELARNTFPSGVNRELASDYHCLVAELGLVVAVEAEAAGHPLSDDVWARLGRMLDAAAAMVDVRGRPPRQGDGDDGRVLLLDRPNDNHWSSLLALGAALVEPLPWWPAERVRQADVRSTLLGHLGGRHSPRGRPESRPAHFPDAGLTLLRSRRDGGSEIWCRCDGGPHGYLGIAAHAHADALSIEVRHDGVDVLADPGTYCYHGDPAWRAYFRSTIAHNTLELDGQAQSLPGGPFLWTAHASTRVLDVVAGPDGEMQSWSAQHDGYERLEPPAVHHRTVVLDQRRSCLRITDHIRCDGHQPCRLAFHLGPKVEAALDGTVARLWWTDDDVPPRTNSARLELPDALVWTAHRGVADPVAGWFSPGFGRKVPSTTLIGSGSCDGSAAPMTTVVSFGTALGKA